MTFRLRPYQEEIIASVRAHFQRGVRQVLVQAPTGSGKTALVAHMNGTASLRGHKCLFIVHRRELIRQSAETFDMVGLRYGIIAAGFPSDPTASIQIGAVQTLSRRLHRLPQFGFICTDEAHHAPAKTWENTLARYPKAFHVGLTATPERLDGKGLGGHYRALVSGPGTGELIAAGWLARYRLYAPVQISVDDVSTRMGDYVRSELAAAVDKPSITGDAITHYIRHAEGKRAVVFCCSIKHSIHVTEQFNAAGIRAEHVDGDTDPMVRDAAMARFRRGTTLVLSNVDLFGEGVDVPAMEAAICLRPTQSLTVCLQQWGRALRPHPGKECAIILDHAGNAIRHGLPDDERVWSLEGRERDGRRRNDTGEDPVRVCPHCFRAQHPGVSACRYCGKAFPKKERKVQHVEGDLREVKSGGGSRQKLREQGRARTREELVRLGRSRGYSPAKAYRWAQAIVVARQRKMIASRVSEFGCQGD